MANLILLNGAPASGKSTLAQRFIETRPLALNLDVDVVRAQLGGWIHQPTEAGLAARALASEMARVHLTSGFDVVVPQFLGRVDFIEQLEHVATSVEARFVEVALMLDRAAAADAFNDRRLNPTDQTHVDAASLVDQSEHLDPLGEMWDSLQQILELRPRTHQVKVIRNDVAATFEVLMSVLNEPKP